MGEETELKLIVPPAKLAKVRHSKVIEDRQTAPQRAPIVRFISSIFLHGSAGVLVLFSK